ncbi:MAG TPA: serine hydrolase domain-containing protein, partial [Terriglobales bacterium]|nr:serine hydrolase domain-containing protein [Terriglobales bacterium]
MVDPKFFAATPESIGIDSERLEQLFARAERDVSAGRLPSAQIAVAREGKLAGLRTFGTARCGGCELPATDHTLYCIYSATKGLIAAAVWLLIENDALRLDERAASIVPEMATNGKDAVTVTHLLTHVA